MIKQIWIAECDICGRMENARFTPFSYKHNGFEYDIPSGWLHVKNNDMCICSNCASALKEKGILIVPCAKEGANAKS